MVSKMHFKIIVECLSHYHNLRFEKNIIIVYSSNHDDRFSLDSREREHWTIMESLVVIHPSVEAYNNYIPLEIKLYRRSIYICETVILG